MTAIETEALAQVFYKYRGYDDDYISNEGRQHMLVERALHVLVCAMDDKDGNFVVPHALIRLCAIADFPAVQESYLTELLHRMLQHPRLLYSARSISCAILTIASFHSERKFAAPLVQLLLQHAPVDFELLSEGTGNHCGILPYLVERGCVDLARVVLSDPRLRAPRRYRSFSGMVDSAQGMVPDPSLFVVVLEHRNQSALSDAIFHTCAHHLIVSELINWAGTTKFDLYCVLQPHLWLSRKLWNALLVQKVVDRLALLFCETEPRDTKLWNKWYEWDFRFLRRSILKHPDGFCATASMFRKQYGSVPYEILPLPLNVYVQRVPFEFRNDELHRLHFYNDEKRLCSTIPEVCADIQNIVDQYVGVFVESPPTTTSLLEHRVYGMPFVPVEETEQERKNRIHRFTLATRDQEAQQIKEGRKRPKPQEIRLVLKRRKDGRMYLGRVRCTADDP